MKHFKTLFVTLLLLIFSSVTFGQAVTPLAKYALLATSKDSVVKKKATKHDPFVSLGAGWTANQDLTYSGEIGAWGSTSPTSFSITFDASHNVAKEASPAFTHWLGIKAYYTVYSAAKICYMVYGKEAMQLDGSKNTLLEVGFNPNYTLSDNWLLGITLGNQTLPGSQWNLFSSLGFVYLVK